MSGWIANGKVADGLPFDDRAWQYGDGLFETIAIRHGRPRFFDWHIERLTTGCARLGIDAPVPALIAEDLEVAVSAAGIDTRHAVAKLVVSAGQGPRGYARAGAGASRYVALFESQPLAESHYRDGVVIRLCATRLAQQPQLAGIKSLNRLEQVLARNEWDDDSAFEGLTCDTAGNVICGTMSNVFITSDNEIVTPDISHAGVAGIMRRKLIETAHQHDIAITVRPIPREELDDAGEIFLTNSQFGLLPVREVGGRALDIGRQTRALTALLVEQGVEDMAC